MTYVTYVPAWQSLSDAVAQVTKANEISEKQAQTDICQAISDGEIRIRVKLGIRTPGGTTSRDTFLKGEQVRIPSDLKPNDLDWERSCPFKPWLVPRGAFKPHGFWTLEYVELYRADVAALTCAPKNDPKAASPSSKPIGLKKRTRPNFERAQRAIKNLYPDRVPEQAIEPNSSLCRSVGDWLRNNGLANVSNDTILRAAGRRS